MNETIKLLTAETRAYIDYHRLPAYVEDVVNVILEERPEKPLKYLHEYFESVRLGVNVVLREYQYICATPRNRASFGLRIRDVLIGNPIKLMEGPDEQPAIENLHQTVRLVCPDFPLNVISDICGLAMTRYRLEKSKGERTHNYSSLEGRNPPVVVQGGMIGTRQGNDPEAAHSVPLSQGFFNLFTTYLFFLEYFAVTKNLFPQIIQSPTNNVPNIQDARHMPTQPLSLVSSLVTSFIKALGSAIDDYEKKEESVEIPPLQPVRLAAQDGFHYYVATSEPLSGLDRAFVKMRIASHSSEVSNGKASTDITSNNPMKDGKVQSNAGQEEHTDIIRTAHDRFVIALAEDPIVLNLIQETAMCTKRDAYEAQKGNKTYWT